MNRKRTLMLFVTMVLLCATCFASILQVGATGTKYVNWSKDNSTEELFNLKDMKYGAEARINISHLTLTAGADFAKLDSINKIAINSSLGGMVTLGPSMANIGLGVMIPHTLGIVGQGNMNYDFMKDPIYLRASLNFNLLFAGISASYIMPTNVPLNGLFSFSDYKNYKAITNAGAIQIAAFIGLI